MGLYYLLSFFMFIMLLFGLRADSEIVATTTGKIKEVIAYRNNLFAHLCSIIFFLIFWFLTAFRSINIGNDTKVYIYYFNIFNSVGLDFSRTFEPGYQILNAIIGKLSLDPHIFLIMIAAILYLGTGVYLHRYSKNILISLVLFFCCCFSLYTSMFRQGIAMVLVLFAYQLLKQRRRARAFVLILLAMTFHISAGLALLLFLVDKIQLSIRMVVVFTMVISILAGTGILNNFLMILVPKYAHYFDSQYSGSGWLAVTYEVIRNLIWFLLVSKAIRDKSSMENRLVITNFMLLLMMSSLGYSVNLFTRASQYFLLIALVELPNTLYIHKLANKRLWLFAICSVMIIMFLLVLLYRPDWNHIYPYEFWEIY